VARVGLSEADARERWGRRAGVDVSSYAELDRAIVAGGSEGFAKLVSDPRGRLVGATIAAPSAGEAVAELAARVASGGTVTGLSEAVHAYPTFAEGPVRAAEDRALGRWTAFPARVLTRSVLTAYRALDRTG
jgi:pyruvate/2-oxoglutarate dehydrogenase complex dihydrolipoamide dehydrogenase (E3) component